MSYLSLNMKKNSRREFLRSSTALASLTTISTPWFLKDKAILHLTVPTDKATISLIHTAGLKGAIEGVGQIGGLNAIQGYLQSCPQSPIFLDTGDFMNAERDRSFNLDYLNELVRSGLMLTALGESEMNIPKADLHYLIEHSGAKILGNALEKNGLILGETYYSKAIIQWGKYKVGVLPTRGISLSEINRKGLELKLIHQCDLILGLGPIPLAARMESLKSKHHEVNHYLSDSGNSFPLGTQVVRSSKQSEFWISKSGEFGQFLGVFHYTMNPAYQVHHITNLSFVPGDANMAKKMAYLSQPFTNSNQVV